MHIISLGIQISLFLLNIFIRFWYLGYAGLNNKIINLKKKSWEVFLPFPFLKIGFNMMDVMYFLIMTNSFWEDVSPTLFNSIVLFSTTWSTYVLGSVCLPNESSIIWLKCLVILWVLNTIFNKSLYINYIHVPFPPLPFPTPP